MSIVDSPERQTIVEEYLAPLNLEQSTSGMFLIKVPEWLGKQILSAPTGTVIGESSVLTPGQPADLRVNPEITLDKPNEFSLRTSQAVNPANSFLLSTHPQSASITPVSQGMHAIPTRTAAYKKVTHLRATTAFAASSERKTIIAQPGDSILSPHGAVHMFKLAGHSPVEQTRRKQPATLPHLRAQSSNNEIAPEELVMKLLVEEDNGWNLQNFMKRFKDAGGSGLNLVQLKSKMTEICDYTRRGEDSHPKYYLKLEYKN